ncbi:prenyltransferase/squalene oxidase repeat-containing protein [Cupriavidus numazuensis]|uniref:Squalene cyclase C-terminal domain-containing protein n=1 Tax=Cupriavidus numazuensis TaxID=221992 RepID=A0ABN7Q5Z5_9BURK|nr:hypothetical protein [Cupriavidus numazuensis]CAG2158326.1 hypothetical protein LMG26411_05937 [Cupriavidus numazuensis]
MISACETAIDRGVAFLRERQRAWGEFACHKFTNAQLHGEGRPDSSPFATTLVLQSLSFVRHASIDGMRSKAIGFLLDEREEPGVWRYWSSRHGAPIDPDLDDTCCAAFALRQAGVDEQRLMSNVRCILDNRHDSGLFKTWLRHADADNDVDGAVNANVLLYLGERPETVAARDIVIEAILADREDEASWYYTSPLALYYMVSRAYFHGVTGFRTCRDAVIEKTRVHARGASQQPMSVALALCILANFGVQDRGIAAGIGLLLQQQDREGAWSRSAFYRGPEPPEAHSVWWGSEELTTALCVEALARSAVAR